MAAYWRRIAKRAWREAALAVGLGTAEKVVVAVFGQALIAALIYVLLGEASLAATEPARLLAAAAPFALWPLLFFWKLGQVPATLDREKREEIADLAANADQRERLESARADLGDLLVQADYLKHRCAVMVPIDEDTVIRWHTACVESLRASLGESAVLSFNSDANVPSLVLSADATARNIEVWGWLNRRASRLDMILQAMPTA